MSCAALLAVFVGFSRTFYLRPQFQTTPLPTYLTIHGLVFTLWIALFLAQTTLVAARRTDVHRRLGWAGAALAALMVIVGVTAGLISLSGRVAAGQADEARAFLAVPLTSMLVFLVLVASAVYYRRYAETHKRLMLAATLSILDAPVARWPIALIASNAYAYYVLTDLFLLAAIVYDLASRGRVHRAYIWAASLIVAAQIVREMVGGTAAWHALARALIG
jgi:hypothetical protein